MALRARTPSTRLLLCFCPMSSGSAAAPEWERDFLLNTMADLAEAHRQDLTNLANFNHRAFANLMRKICELQAGQAKLFELIQTRMPMADEAPRDGVQTRMPGMADEAPRDGSRWQTKSSVLPLSSSIVPASAAAAAASDHLVFGVASPLANVLANDGGAESASSDTGPQSSSTGAAPASAEAAPASQPDTKLGNARAHDSPGFSPGKSGRSGVSSRAGASTGHSVKDAVHLWPNTEVPSRWGSTISEASWPRAPGAPVPPGAFTAHASELVARGAEAQREEEAAVAAAEAQREEEAEVAAAERRLREVKEERAVVSAERKLQEAEALVGAKAAIAGQDLFVARGRLLCSAPAAPPRAAPPQALKIVGSVLGGWAETLAAAQPPGAGAAAQNLAPVLANARGLLRAAPAPASAAQALTIVGRVAANSPLGPAIGALRTAERAVRDVVVLRCCSSTAPRDRDAFLASAEEAFGEPLKEVNLDLHSQLLLAYKKVVGSDAFPSKAQISNARRGGPRPRRSRSSSPPREKARATGPARLIAIPAGPVGDREPMWVLPPKWG